MKDIVNALINSDNEGTDSPWWMVIDTGPMMDIIEGAIKNEEKPRHDYLLSSIAMSCIVGPFFSREDAEGYLKSRSYDYSKHAKVWCSSGYRSQKYRSFYRNEIDPVRHQVTQQKQKSSEV